MMYNISKLKEDISKYGPITFALEHAGKGAFTVSLESAPDDFPEDKLDPYRVMESMDENYGTYYNCEIKVEDGELVGKARGTYEPEPEELSGLDSDSLKSIVDGYLSEDELSQWYSIEFSLHYASSLDNLLDDVDFVLYDENDEEVSVDNELEKELREYLADQVVDWASQNAIDEIESVSVDGNYVSMEAIVEAEFDPEYVLKI